MSTRTSIRMAIYLETDQREVLQHRDLVRSDILLELVAELNALLALELVVQTNLMSTDMLQQLMCCDDQYASPSRRRTCSSDKYYGA